MLSNFKIVLVETSHPGNIGAVSRAMKNMGMDRLCLVSPKVFPSADATARASGAHDVLSAAVVYDTLQEAIGDCHTVFGASARDRTIAWPELSVRACAEKFVASYHASDRFALVFGRENSGLNNHELDLCHYLLRIPSNPAFSSLNLAAAVQIVCYEFYMAHLAQEDLLVEQKQSEKLATTEQMDAFYQHLYETIADIGFLHPDKSRSIMRRLRRIFNRAHLESRELDILRGILRFSQNHNVK